MFEVEFLSPEELSGHGRKYFCEYFFRTMTKNITLFNIPRLRSLNGKTFFQNYNLFLCRSIIDIIFKNIACETKKKKKIDFSIARERNYYM